MGKHIKTRLPLPHLVARIFPSIHLPFVGVAVNTFGEDGIAREDGKDVVFPMLEFVVEVVSKQEDVLISGTKVTTPSTILPATTKQG